MPAPHAETETGSNYRTMCRSPRVERYAVTAATVIPSGGSALFAHLCAISARSTENRSEAGTAHHPRRTGSRDDYGVSLRAIFVGLGLRQSSTSGGSPIGYLFSLCAAQC